jgi:tRNA modification GTPase
MLGATTVVALLTPPGRGALATIGVRGPNAWQYTNACITPSIVESAASSPPRPWLRHFHGEQGTSEELVVVFSQPEEGRIHCHGGIAACEAVLQALERQGVERIDWKEWTKQSNPAQISLADALTERTALILLDQLQGAYEQELIEIRALIETHAADASTLQRLEDLIGRGSIGLHLTEPWRVVIAGHPNAGKSSLLNALLGFQRSITSPQPGTTRDVVTARTAFDGWPIELRDTAGLRTASDEIESIGVALAKQELQTADLVLYLIPADKPAQEVEQQLASLRTLQQSPLLVVRTKADLPGEPAADGFAVSALTGAGLAKLSAAIVQRMIGDAPLPGAPTPLSPAHLQELQEMREAIIRRTTFSTTANTSG